MDFRRIILIIAAAAAVITSCKKDEEDEAKPFIKGTMEIEGLPEFITPAFKCSLTAKGAEHPEGKDISYSWKVSPGMDKYDTTDVFNYVFPDSLCTYTVYCNAFATGYTSNSTFAYTTAAKAGKDGSITGIDYQSEILDGKYYYGTVGEDTWTFNNLAEGNGLGFRKSEVMAEVFGRFYSHADAVAACESLSGDWVLPTKEDWEKLETYVKSNPSSGKSTAAALMGDASFNGTLMWDYWPAVGDITNSTGFSAIPVGYANTKTGNFTGTYEYAVFWTSTSVEDDDTMAYYKYLIFNEPDMFTGKADKESFGASVRCIRK
jgi:uncharacterized protein (TIGR02145 family)